MNPDTGAIATFETEEDARKAGHTVPLSDAESRRLMPMNRHQRRAWAKQQRVEQRRKNRRNR